MKCLFWRLLCLLIGGSLPLPLAAADYLVVFDQGATVSIYDAGTFELLGSPTVGEGAIHAVGVPDPLKPERTSEDLRGRVSLRGRSGPGATLRSSCYSSAARAYQSRRRKCIVLTADGRQLLVVGGSVLHAFEAWNSDNPVPKVLGLESDVTGLAVLPDASRAYLAISGSDEVRVVNLLTLPPQLGDFAVALPAEPSAIAAAPNASAAVRVGCRVRCLKSTPETRQILSTI